MAAHNISKRWWAGGIVAVACVAVAVMSTTTGRDDIGCSDPVIDTANVLDDKPLTDVTSRVYDNTLMHVRIRSTTTIPDAAGVVANIEQCATWQNENGRLNDNTVIIYVNANSIAVVIGGVVDNTMAVTAEQEFRAHMNANKGPTVATAYALGVLADDIRINHLTDISNRPPPQRVDPERERAQRAADSAALAAVVLGAVWLIQKTQKPKISPLAELNETPRWRETYAFYRLWFVGFLVLWQILYRLL